MAAWLGSPTGAGAGPGDVLGAERHAAPVRCGLASKAKSIGEIPGKSIDFKGKSTGK